MKSFFIFFIFIKLVFSEPSCTEGTKFCLRCESNLCVECENEVLIPDQDGGCEGAKSCTNGQNYCIECDGNLCRNCEENYFPDENGGCSTTDNCLISYQGICLECEEDFLLVGENDKICKSRYSEDFRNCQTINMASGFCDECQEGYYLNSGDFKCIDKPNCKFSTLGICDECNKFYYLNKMTGNCELAYENFSNCKISLDGINCDSCNEKFYFDENKRCIASNYCSKGDDYFALKCERCISNYILTDFRDACVKTENCFSGDKDLGTCEECNSEFYLDLKDGNCKSSVENNQFLNCRIADEGKCIDCIYDNFLDLDNRCVNTKYCSESENGECLICIDNYHLGLDKICSNVEKCTYTTSDDVCYECEENYYYNRASKLCESEKENFENCKFTDYTGQVCDRCRDDVYYINLTNHLCYSNEEQGDFYKCIYTDEAGEKCAGCSNGYYLGAKDNKCTTFDGCNFSENENKCLECSYFYCLDINTGRCEKNDIIENEEKKFYYLCKQTNKEGTACDICNEGLELINGLCLNVTACNERSNDGACRKCVKDDRNYIFYCLNSNFECVETHFDGCEKCDNLLNFNLCTRCNDGYELDEYGTCTRIQN